MTRARILKPAHPGHGHGPDLAPQRAARPAAPALDLPWLPDSPAPPRARRGARAALARILVESLAGTLGALRRAGAAWRSTPASLGTAPPQSLRQRAALLFAILTVPAMAAPGDFTLFAAPEPAAPAPDPLALAAASALPFERPGMSFPGSAFFFLDDPPGDTLIALPTADPQSSGAEAGRALGEFIAAGPAAKPFFSTGAGLSHARALECLAQAVWYEAANESEAGQRAVAQVVLNRVAHPSWPGSVCGVVYQGAERATGCQFTFTCDGSLARRAGGASWARAQAIAAEALAGKVYAPVGHATHYHALWVNPSWARTLDHVGTIGAHRFYRNRGPGGEKAAFTMAYAGVEPSLAGRTNPPPSPDTPASFGEPPALPVTFAGLAPEPAAAQPGARTGAKAPTARAGKAADKRAAQPQEAANAAFSGAGEVRPEFANAGQWKLDPVAAP